MSFPNPGRQSVPALVPVATNHNLVYSRSLSAEFGWMSESDPPAYSQHSDNPPPYWQTSISVKDTFRFDESSRQQELQLLLGVLFSIMVTLVLMDALPTLGEPASSIHTIRIHGWFTLALFLCLLLVSVSLLCRSWLTQNHPNLRLLVRRGPWQAPETRLQVLTQSVMNRLIASGPVLMYAMMFSFVVGLVDFFWQLYPTLGMAIVTTCGIHGSGPILSSLSQRPFKIWNSWQFVRAWTALGISPRAGNTQLVSREELEH